MGKIKLLRICGHHERQRGLFSVAIFTETGEYLTAFMTPQQIMNSDSKVEQITASNQHYLDLFLREDKDAQKTDKYTWKPGERIITENK